MASHHSAESSSVGPPQYTNFCETSSSTFFLLHTLTSEAETRFLQSRFSPLRCGAESSWQRPVKVVVTGVESAILAAFIENESLLFFGNPHVQVCTVELDFDAVQCGRSTLIEAIETEYELQNMDPAHSTRMFQRSADSNSSAIDYEAQRWPHFAIDRALLTITGNNMTIVCSGHGFEDALSQDSAPVDASEPDLGPSAEDIQAEKYVGRAPSVVATEDRGYGASSAQPIKSGDGSRPATARVIEDTRSGRWSTRLVEGPEGRTTARLIGGDLGIGSPFARRRRPTLTEVQQSPKGKAFSQDYGTLEASRSPPMLAAGRSQELGGQGAQADVYWSNTERFASPEDSNTNAATEIEKLRTDRTSNFESLWMMIGFQHPLEDDEEEPLPPTKVDVIVFNIQLTLGERDPECFSPNTRATKMLVCKQLGNAFPEYYMDFLTWLLDEVSNILSDTGVAYIWFPGEDQDDRFRAETLKEWIRGWEGGNGLVWEVATLATSADDDEVIALWRRRDDFHHTVPDDESDSGPQTHRPG